MTQERLEVLMVKVVDEVATPAEREELMSHVSEHPELASELDAHRALRAATDGWVARLEHDLALDRAAPVGRIERGLGLTALLSGLAVLIGGGLALLFTDPEVPRWVAVGVGLVAGGSTLLLASVVRWRLSMRESDPYTGVVR